MKARNPIEAESAKDYCGVHSPFYKEVKPNQQLPSWQFELLVRISMVATVSTVVYWCYRLIQWLL